MEEILLFWGGDERGNDFSGPAHDFPFCVPVGSQAPHAAGVAYAFKLRARSRASRCACSATARPRRATSFEAMNFAGVQKLPVVFVVNNNQWAISVPLALQTASETLAQKAIAAGFPGEQVDGNDVIAVRAAADEAIAAGSHGKRPAPDRGRDLSARRPHDGGRCRALSSAGGGAGALEGGADRAAARLSRRPQGVGQGGGGAARRRMPGTRSRRRSSVIWRPGRARPRPCSIISMPSCRSVYAGQRERASKGASRCLR